MNTQPKIGSEWHKAIVESKVVVLTGAGASVPLGMPAMDSFYSRLPKQWQDLALRILASFQKENNDLEFLLGRIAFYEELLREWRQDNYLRNWADPGGLEGIVKPLRELRERVFDFIVSTYGQLSLEARTKAGKLYVPLFRKLLSGTQNQPKVLPIFTTNYDLTFEALRATDSSFKFCTGLLSAGDYSYWDSSAYDQNGDLPFAVFRLHGCSHWVKDKVTGEIVFQARPDRKDLESKEPHILYPVPGKDGRISEEPFQTGYQHLRLCLENAERVVIIGYSERDAAIQKCLRDAFGTKPGRSILLVTGGEQLRPELHQIKNLTSSFTHWTGGIEANTGNFMEARWDKP